MILGGLRRRAARLLDPGHTLGLCPGDAARVAEEASALAAMWAGIGRKVRVRVGGCWVELVPEGETERGIDAIRPGDGPVL